MYFHLDFSRTIIKKSRVLIINKLLANLACFMFAPNLGYSYYISL